MSLTVVGSIAFDSVRTPFGERERMLGGSAVHFALAASFFTDVHVVGPVGDDFGEEHLELLRARGVDVTDIERVAGGQTFFWRGHYEADLNVAHTDDTQLGVFADFEPKLSEASKRADVLFLGNIQPDLQRRVRAQCATTRLAALDSMNLWIETTRDSLLAAIGEVDCVMLNDAEVRMLTEEPNLARAARAVMEMGPRIVVAKRGEYGAVLFTSDGFFALPGLLLEDVRDPTGAGDSFAGGFLGYLDMQGTEPPQRGSPAPGDRARHRARLLQRRGVRHRAGCSPYGVGDRRALRGAARDDPLRASRLSEQPATAGSRPARRRSNGSATESAFRAPSSGAARRAAVSSRVVPSASRCSPLTATVLRRSSRAGVERRRWATLRPKQAAVTRTPAAASPSESMPSAMTQKPVSAGKAPQAAANQKSVWKRPPASSRL